MTTYRNPAVLLSAAAIGAMTLMACSPDTHASGADSEAARAANEAARTAALASGAATDAVDDLVAANDALLLRIEELETRLVRENAASPPARRQSAPASEATRYDRSAPARDDDYRVADSVDGPPVERPTYDAPSSRWDEGYQEPGARHDNAVLASEVALDDGDWGARPASYDLPLPSRAPDRDADRPVEPTYSRLTVGEGSPIAIEILDPISTRYSRPGDTFTARLAGDLLADDGRVAIRDGAQIAGHVSEVRKDQRIGGRAGLTVVLDTIELPDGTTAPLQAAWATQGKSQTKKDAATIGGATVGGAILGRILDKGDGDVIGGLIGAAAGSAVARQKMGQPIVLDEGAILRMTLRAPIEVTVRN